MAFGRLYYCAKFGWNPYSRFDASFNSLRVRLDNAYSRPQKLGLPEERGLGRPLTQVASWSIRPFGHNRHGPKSGWLLCPLFGGAVSPSNTMAEAYLRTKWRLDPPSLLATTDMRQKLGAVLLF